MTDHPPAMVRIDDALICGEVSATWQAAVRELEFAARQTFSQ